MRLSVDSPALLPGTNWLPLAQSNSMKVRASPQAVGVRVSKLTFDCCGEMKVRLVPRERAGLGASGKTPATGAPKWKCSGAAFNAPLLPKFVVVFVVVLGLPPVKKYMTLTVIAPPTRIEVSVPGIRNERGKLPPTMLAPAVAAGAPPG